MNANESGEPTPPSPAGIIAASKSGQVERSTLSAEDQRMLATAEEVRSRAYAPYSRFRVGAAVRSDDGHVFTGVNIENASFGLTLCAERSALAAAISSGHSRFNRLVVVSEGGVAPCGACRQFVREFAEDLEILLVDTKAPDQPRRFQLSELLPESFSATALPGASP